jgi:ribosomal protein L33
LLQVFSFETDKLEMAKFCYNYCFDVDNYFQLNSVFTFESSISELTNYTSSQNRGRPNPWANGGGMVNPGPGGMQVVPNNQPNGWNNNPQQMGGAGCGMPTMNPGQWSGAVGSVSSNSFASTQKTVARNILQNNCVTAGQIRELLEVFTFDSDKLEIAKFAYASCADPQNYYMVNDVFDFESSVTELTEFIGGR